MQAGPDRSTWSDTGNLALLCAPRIEDLFVQSIKYPDRSDLLSDFQFKLLYEIKVKLLYIVRFVVVLLQVDITSYSVG